MAAEAVKLIVCMAASVFLTWTALANLRTGEFATRSGMAVRRADNPSVFWIAVGLTFVLAAFFLVVALATGGKMAGWWEFTL